MTLLSTRRAATAALAGVAFVGGYALGHVAPTPGTPTPGTPAATAGPAAAPATAAPTATPPDGAAAAAAVVAAERFVNAYGAGRRTPKDTWLDVLRPLVTPDLMTQLQALTPAQVASIDLRVRSTTLAAPGDPRHVLVTTDAGTVSLTLDPGRWLVAAAS